MKKLEELVGKTIDRISYEPFTRNPAMQTEYLDHLMDNGGLALHFTDGTAILFEPNGYETDGILWSDLNG